MTIRSAPPSSSNLAEIPVPAPAPMIGIPREIWCFSFCSMVARFFNVSEGETPKIIPYGSLRSARIKPAFKNSMSFSHDFFFKFKKTKIYLFNVKEFEI
jgi:hypothetical protein